MRISKVAAAKTPAERHVSRGCRGAECSCRSALLSGGQAGHPTTDSRDEDQGQMALAQYGKLLPEKRVGIEDDGDGVLAAGPSAYQEAPQCG
jgi:hypothetical protein